MTSPYEWKILEWDQKHQTALWSGLEPLACRKRPLNDAALQMKECNTCSHVITGMDDQDPILFKGRRFCSYTDHNNVHTWVIYSRTEIKTKIRRLNDAHLRALRFLILSKILDKCLLCRGKSFVLALFPLLFLTQCHNSVFSTLAIFYNF